MIRVSSPIMQSSTFSSLSHPVFTHLFFFGLYEYSPESPLSFE